MEFHVDRVHFSFFCKPYLLKLQFPHEVVDNELAKAVYDPNKDNGMIVVHLPKNDPGQHFEDLDLITKLMQPKKAPPVDLRAISTPKPLIEVIDSTYLPDGEVPEPSASNASTTSIMHDSTLIELERRFKAVAAEEDADMTSIAVTANLSPNYGFNDAYAGVFSAWHGEVTEILSLPEPDRTPVTQRRILRESAEDEQFDVERYLLDFANADNDCYYEMAMEYVPFWHQYQIISCDIDQNEPGALATKLQNLSLDPNQASTTMALTDSDRELLLRLPNKEFLIEPNSNAEAILFGGLVDILIAFVYDHVTTQGDSSVESTWTTSIISTTLSWLDSTADLKDVVRSSIRRILTFPLLRQYSLAVHVVHQTIALLRRGKRIVLRSLLSLYQTIEKSETQYLLNTVYIQDYCIWIQTVSNKRLLALAEDLSMCIAQFQKSDCGWALVEMEEQLLQHEESDDASSDEDYPAAVVYR